MSATMHALVKSAPGPGAELRQVPRPQPGPREALVRVELASICGTDLHIYNWDAWAQSRIRPPLIFGHEFCGRVEAVGAETSFLRPGDRVSGEMHVACGQCMQCRTGDAHVCPSVRILGVDAAGCFAEYVTVPESNLWQLAASVPAEYAAILDPLGNAVHTVMAGEVTGRSVAIIGCGPIGLMAINVARAAGAGAIFALEPHPGRRARAQIMGADHVFAAADAPTEAAILALTPGRGVDVALEFSGSVSGIHSALRLARPGGRVSLLGLPSRPVEIDLSPLVIFKGLTIQGINGRRMYDTWYQMEQLLGRLNLAPLITHRLPLSEFAAAMKLLQDGDAAKILLEP
jgi:threonine 3-dehydrogenase